MLIYLHTGHTEIKKIGVICVTSVFLFSEIAQNYALTFKAEKYKMILSDGVGGMS